MNAINEDKETAKALEALAREQLIHKLLSDLVFDMQVCQIEGWDPYEYPKRLKAEIDRICEQFEKGTKV